MQRRQTAPSTKKRKMTYNLTNAKANLQHYAILVYALVGNKITPAQRELIWEGYENGLTVIEVANAIKTDVLTAIKEVRA